MLPGEGEGSEMVAHHRAQRHQADSRTISTNITDMIKMSILGLTLYTVLALSIAGQPAKPDEQPVTIRLDVNLTLLHAAVIDRAGQFVAGLDKTNFQLFVDETSRPITVFEPDDAPLVDNSASMTAKGSHVIAASLAFARACNPQDEMFVVHFSDQARLGLPPDKPFTGSISELETALSAFTAEGTTALYDAVALAISHLRETKLDRKILLIISDGGDNSSHEDLTTVLQMAQKTGVIIYCIGIYDDEDRDRKPRVLTAFSEVTGGKAFFPSELKDVRGTCVKIASDIRRQYTLGFEGQEDGEYHLIKITAQSRAHGDLRVRTRAGYFAPRP
jgi:Ca-activated chloride channel family protein